MKELLYIPNGMYYRFNGNSTPFEEYVSSLFYLCPDIRREDFEEEIIQRACNFFYDGRNYSAIGITLRDWTRPLSRNEFEIVEV